MQDFTAIVINRSIPIHPTIVQTIRRTKDPAARRIRLLRATRLVAGILRTGRSPAARLIQVKMLYLTDPVVVVPPIQTNRAIPPWTHLLAVDVDQAVVLIQRDRAIHPAILLRPILRAKPDQVAPPIQQNLGIPLVTLTE